MAEGKMNAKGGSPNSKVSRGTNAKQIAKDNKTGGNVDKVNGLERVTY